MHFVWPQALWALLLAPLLLAFYLWLLRRKQRSALAYPSLALVRAAMGPRKLWRRHVPPALLGLALISAVVKLPEEPRPVPEGISAKVVISTWGTSRPSMAKTSRIMGCLISGILSTCSKLEYLRNTPGVNGLITVTKTYLSIAAAKRKPPCSR
jgi:hypothetical protein